MPIQSHKITLNNKFYVSLLMGAKREKSLENFQFNNINFVLFHQHL